MAPPVPPKPPGHVPLAGESLHPYGVAKRLRARVEGAAALFPRTLRRGREHGKAAFHEEDGLCEPGLDGLDSLCGPQNLGRIPGWKLATRRKGKVEVHANLVERVPEADALDFRFPVSGVGHRAGIDSAHFRDH